MKIKIFIMKKMELQKDKSSHLWTFFVDFDCRYYIIFGGLLRRRRLYEKNIIEIIFIYVSIH